MLGICFCLQIGTLGIPIVYVSGGTQMIAIVSISKKWILGIPVVAVSKKRDPRDLSLFPDRDPRDPYRFYFQIGTLGILGRDPCRLHFQIGTLGIPMIHISM